jgi:hypothetical protein
MITKTINTTCSNFLTEDPELKLWVVGPCTVVCDVLLESGDGCYLGFITSNNTTYMKFLNDNFCNLSLDIPNGVETNIGLIYSIGKASNPIILAGSTIGEQI